MPKKKEARPKSLFNYLKPGLEDFESFIAKESEKIKQNPHDRKVFSRLVNIKRGLS